MQDDIITRSLTKEEQDAVRRLADTTRNDPRYVRTEELDRYLCQINADESTIRVLQGAFAKLEIYRANFRVWLQHLRQKLPGFPQTPAPQRGSAPPPKELNTKMPESARTGAQKAEKEIPSQQTPTQPVWKKFVKPKPHEAKPATAELTADDQAQLTKLVKVLQVKNYAGKTIAAYSGAVRRLMHYARGLGKPITELSDDEFLDYAVRLQQRGSSHETLRILRSALLFHLEEVLGRPRKLPLLSGMRRAKKLPVVLSQDEVERLLQAIKNDKHRLMVSLLYSSGLRVSEVVKLRVRDVDLGDMHLAVRGGKGRKDRISVLSPAQRELLLQMMKGKAGHEFVFTSAYAPKKALSVRSLQHVFERAVLKAGIQKKATCHSLRHSFATHLLESGTDLRLIQKLLGHENVTTTTIYTHIAERSVKAVASPLKGMASI